MSDTNRSTSQWQALDRDHFLHPFTDFKELNRKGSRIIARAEGAYLWDTDGNRYLDGMSGLWCVNVGYGREELAEVAARQMRELPYYNAFFQTAHPPAIELSARLSDITPDGLEHVFFTGSGSEANDTVVRTARRYFELLGHEDKQIIISRDNAYHGSTMAGASLGGMKFMHEQGGLPIPGIVHIGQPYWFKEGRGEDPAEFGLRVARQLEQKIDELGEHRVAAFIAEPIQGAGGVVIPPETYWPEISRICRERDILLVVDEVICGFGRTGKWFGSDTFELKPDLMPIAKGLSSGYLPIGGVMVADRIARVLTEEGGEFAHGFTYSGHPVCCAVASANIDILKREKIIENVAENTAPYLQSRWRELAEHPLVGEARGLGFLGALELVKDKSRNELFDPPGKVGLACREKSFKNGLVMRAVGDTMIIAPPLICDKSQIDELIDKVRKTLDETLAEIGT
ncbi:MAG: aspartate aminotransferase family protein [Proteobacteria bacterium]|nr:MAG: aspartate aminotransferase family protein [Pseudomonadota bacterium]